MRRSWGSLYLIRPHVVVDDPADTVVGAYKRGRALISIAIEQLELVGEGLGRVLSPRNILRRARRMAATSYWTEPTAGTGGR